MASAGSGAAKLLDALPHPVVAVLADGSIAEANSAAEAFFGMSRASLWQQRLANLVLAFSPLLSLVEQVKSRGAAINEYRVDLNLAKPGSGRLVDIFVTPLQEPAGSVVIMLQERSLAEKIDRQLSHQGAGRSAAAMASVLAHEIKNPLSGIRGAAQLLEAEATDADRSLTRLICEETDRIVKLVDRMSAFSERRPAGREKVNIHAVLDHVRKVSQAGFARHIRFHENYDPSLPAVLGNKDQLIQIFLNLVKNAAEAIGESRSDGDIELTTAFRPGVRLQIPGTKVPVSLPLEFCVRDNGSGVAPDLLPYLYDPFVTTKAAGTGLGLALVAKIVGDHGGTIECESFPRRTTFRVLMPMYAPARA
ncbi:MAG: two-component sensor histidine kinase [Beijerinckiaceae bacterium]|nr:MAG: two-component sensor histidine kinase [Beijerinckiaceae bacterium]